MPPSVKNQSPPSVGPGVQDIGTLLAGAQATLAGATEINNLRGSMARNLVIAILVASLVGLLVPSGVSLDRPGQVIPISDVIEWDDPMTPRHTESRIHMLTVRTVNLPWLVAQIMKLGGSGAISESTQLPDRAMIEHLEDRAVVRSVWAGQNLVGIPHTEEVEHLSGTWELEGDLFPAQLGLKEGDRITHIEGVRFDSVQGMYQDLEDVMTRQSTIQVTAVLDGEKVVRDLVVPPGPFDGEFMLAGAEPIIDLKPRAATLRPHESWAGASVSLALTMAFYERYALEQPLQQEIAATGVVNSQGTIDGVLGVENKVVAAHRRGISIVLVPRGPTGDAAVEYGKRAGIEVIRVYRLSDVVEIMERVSRGEDPSP